MVSQSKAFVVGLLSLFCSVQSVRVRRRTQQATDAKQTSIHGVPAYNHHEDKQEWIVIFKEGTSEESMNRICGGHCHLAGHPNRGGVRFAEVRGYDMMEAIAREHGGEIELVEGDQTDYMIPIIEENLAVAELRPTAAASWGLDKVGVSGRPATGKGVHIYVHDTGVRASHTDFGGRVIPTIDLTSGDGVEECAVTGLALCGGDKQGHGTHCAGSAAGTTFGVASEATIHAVKTLSDEGSGARSWQMTAIDWVTINGERPTVISMSLGGKGSDPSYTVAIGAAVEAGITVVVAAGNSNADACNFSPAFAEQAITVGATTSTDTRASYSNYGTCNDIMAPGSAIMSTSAGSDTGSRALSGTSMACPHVSGAAALLLQLNPDWKRDDILASLIASSRPGVITDLVDGDPDHLLWVSAEPAPAPPPPPAPTPEPVAGCNPAFSTGPDSDGDCRCHTRKYCYSGGKSRCQYSLGGTSFNWFSSTCTNCVCK